LALDRCDEGVDDRRVELRPARTLQLGDRFAQR
jgi:hypothetical protein